MINKKNLEELIRNCNESNINSKADIVLNDFIVDEFWVVDSIKRSTIKNRNYSISSIQCNKIQSSFIFRNQDGSSVTIFVYSENKPFYVSPYLGKYHDRPRVRKISSKWYYYRFNENSWRWF